MVATDASEDAWYELLPSQDFSGLPQLASAIARRYARAELRRATRFYSLLGQRADGSEYEWIGQEATQELTATVSAKLDDVRSALVQFGEPDRSILLCMLRGMSLLDIAREVKRAVPLLVGDMARIRAELTLVCKNDNP